MEVNYLKIGNKVYSISEIQAKGLDINKELKEFYEERHGQLAEEFGQVLNDDMQQEWDTQIAHLRKFEDKGNICVPASMFGKPCIVHQNMLMPLRCVVYSPNTVTTTKAWLRSNGCISVDNMTRGRWRAIESNASIALTITAKFVFPLWLAYNQKANTMHTPNLQTFHTMGGGRVCTGNHSAKDYWRLSDADLETQMNRINTFSPAGSSVNVGGVNYRFRDIINEETITNIELRGEQQWRT